jgi:DNA-binding MarR family transcriptional regulator
MALSINISVDEETFEQMREIAEKLGIKPPGYSNVIKRCVKEAYGIIVKRGEG